MSHRKDLLYRIALTMVPNIGPVQARLLLEKFGDAETIFQTSPSRLAKTEKIGDKGALAIKNFNQFKRAEEEIRFIERQKIFPLYFSDNNFPRRLLNCHDCPTLLYYKGQVDLNTSRIVSIIGSRKFTDYGQQVTSELVQFLAGYNATIVSGLAFGIDSIAHRSSLKYDIATIGITAHGFDIMYPSQNLQLAKEMIEKKGGVLTEFMTKTSPDKFNFPSRNRIVAGMSDCTIVIETGTKGGSMITADLANGYNRDVFAIPGRIGQEKSVGCNELIRQNKAVILHRFEDLPVFMGWHEQTRKPATQQKELFAQLNADEQKIISIITKTGTASIDHINLQSGISVSKVAAAILSLELKGLLLSLPGKIYKVC